MPPASAAASASRSSIGEANRAAGSRAKALARMASATGGTSAAAWVSGLNGDDGSRPVTTS